MKAIIKNQQILNAVENKCGKQVAYIQDGMDEDIIYFTDGSQAHCFVNIDFNTKLTVEITFLNDNWEVVDILKMEC